MLAHAIILDNSVACYECPHTVLCMQDDCTFFVDGWQFDGEGPAVEWWGAKRSAAPPPGRNPYIARYITNAKKIGELGAPGSYQTGALSFCNAESVRVLTLCCCVWTESMGHFGSAPGAGTASSCSVLMLGSVCSPNFLLPSRE